MGYDDRISDLQRRLDLLPPDLENLYGAILDNLDPFYFEHAAQYFQLLDACKDPPSAILFAFADEGENDFATSLAIKELTNEEYRIRIETIRRRVNSRCKGLLEVASEGTQFRDDYFEVVERRTVQFLHRTVKDFTRTPAVAAKLMAATESFDSHARLCSANLALLKTTKVASILNGEALSDKLREVIVNRAASCLDEASVVKNENSRSMIAVLDNLGITIQPLFNSSGDNGHLITEDIYRSIAASKHTRKLPHHSYGTCLLSVAVQKGVTEYIAVRATAPGCLVRRTQSQEIEEFEKPGAGKLVNKIIAKIRPDSTLAVHYPQS
ncbi:hypothetical protein ColLi_11505 [Colletotrichum liriopes]|uniref:DUF7791 domain-containing protein n=1 Tax=Colletotrichum liriopes TaxID=708192 RepID=A0AA37GYI0_9PEZI|nr:hypothetical protein ColLi_11505 [Colletotrichum liriopes]